MISTTSEVHRDEKKEFLSQRRRGRGTHRHDSEQQPARTEGVHFLNEELTVELGGRVTKTTWRLGVVATVVGEGDGGLVVVGRGGGGGGGRVVVGGAVA